MTQASLPGVHVRSLPSEKDFQRAVLDVCRLYGWTVAHFRPALTRHGWRTPVTADGAGFPDLLLVKGPRILVRELKAEKGRLSMDQREWLDRFAEAGVDAAVWKPTMWREIVHDLSDGHARVIA